MRLFFPPSQVRFVELSDNAKILPKCRETWLVLFSATGKAENLSKCRQAWLILFQRFCERKFPSQSSLAHKLMCSGFFYLPKVSEKLPQPGCISIRLMYSGFFYLPPFKMIFNIKERKKAKKNCQQHPVFPGGHPSKYWLGSTLLNFSDRTRTGVFSVIWPLALDMVKF